LLESKASCHSASLARQGFEVAHPAAAEKACGTKTGKVLASKGVKVLASKSAENSAKAQDGANLKKRASSEQSTGLDCLDNARHALKKKGRQRTSRLVSAGAGKRGLGKFEDTCLLRRVCVCSGVLKSLWLCSIFCGCAPSSVRRPGEKGQGIGASTGSQPSMGEPPIG
jgi:hypothetical protein